MAAEFPALFFSFVEDIDDTGLENSDSEGRVCITN